MEKMIQENAVFETGTKAFFYEGGKVYNSETGEVVIDSNNDFIDVYWVQGSYRFEPHFYLFFTKKEEKGEHEEFTGFGGETCAMQGYVLSEKDGNVKIERLEDTKFEYTLDNYEYYNTYYGNICKGPYRHDSFGGFVINSIDLENGYYDTNYPGKTKNIKKYSTEFAEKLEPPKEEPKQEDQPKTEEPKEPTTNTIKNEINQDNQFFKDVDLKNFDFKYKEITVGTQTYIIQDSTEYQNYIANKVNEFTLFTYISIFFIFTFATFNFIKNFLGK